MVAHGFRGPAWGSLALFQTVDSAVGQLESDHLLALLSWTNSRVILDLRFLILQADVIVLRGIRRLIILARPSSNLSDPHLAQSPLRLALLFPLPRRRLCFRCGIRPPGFPKERRGRVETGLEVA